MSLVVCIVMSFHSIWLSVLVLYPADQIFASSLHLLSLACFCCSKYHSTFLFPILSSFIHILCLQLHLSLHHLPIQLLLLYTFPSSSLRTTWELVLSLSSWSNLPMQLLYFLLVLFSFFYSKGPILRSLLTCLSCLVASFPLPSFSLDLTFLLYILSFFILFQNTHPSWIVFLSFFLSLFQNTLSLLKQTMLCVMMVTIIMLIAMNMKSATHNTLIANLILLGSYLVLFALHGYVSMKGNVFGYSEEQMQELRQVLHFLSKEGIHQYYVNHQNLCYNEESLYYHLIGLPYEYILLTPFDMKMTCGEEQAYYDQIQTMDSTYLLKVFESIHNSFSLYHIVH